jgi:chaperonin GroEL
MPTNVNFQPKEKIMSGIKTLHDAVTSSLGPKGKNTMIDRGYEVVVIHDGVSIARSIELKDTEENAAVRSLREAAQKQVSQVGDGTTVVVSLAYNIVKEAEKIIAAGESPMTLRAGLESGRDLLVNEIKNHTVPVKTLDDAVRIATISAEDGELGKLVGETLWKIGTEGIVTVEESKSDTTVVEHQEGMQFDKGYISSYFVTDPNRMEATVEDAYLLISDMEITNIHELVTFLEKVGKKTRNLVVIAPEVSGSALESFVLTKVNGGMNVLAVRAPLFEEKQKSFLQDLAILTGGKVVTKEAGMRFEKLTEDYLGRARRVTSTKDATLIVGGKGSEEDIKARVESIRAQIKDSESEFDIKKLEERLAKLTSGVAIIKVGGHTEVEMKERKERAEDAKEATRAALRLGVVPGGETIYLQARKVLGTSLGHQILYRALEKPFFTLLENAGYNPGQMLERVENLDGKIDHVGIDVMDGEAKDLIQSGIIDPAEVSVQAIKNAVSVAIQIITTNCLITPEKEEKKK